VIGKPRGDGAYQVTTTFELRFSVIGAAGLAGFHAQSKDSSSEYALIPKLFVD
jgi:hypothetical protein